MKAKSLNTHKNICVMNVHTYHNATLNSLAYMDEKWPHKKICHPYESISAYGWEAITAYPLMN